MPTDRIRVIECRGSPRLMGRQYGEQARDEIRKNAEIFECASTPADTDPFVENARQTLKRYTPDILDELAGLSEGAGISLGRLLRLNQVDTFQAERPSPGCTSLAIAESPAGPVLGKNNDGEPGGLRFIIRKTIPDQGFGLTQVTYAGWLSGLDAMNTAGLVNGHNSVGSRFAKTGARLDIRLWAYHLMRRCGTAAEFIAQAGAVPLTGKGFNIVVVDSSGDTCVLEAAVPLVAQRDRGKSFVYATNHYASDAFKDADRRNSAQKAVSIYRYGYLRWREATSPPRTAADIAGILSSHEPWAPCRHGAAHGSSTLWSMVGMPARRCLRVASGPPCSNSYAEYGVE